jgi:hypothetical protein
MALPYFNSKDFSDRSASFPQQGLYLRRAKVIKVDHNKGVIDVEFLDFGGNRKQIPFAAAAHGMFDVPVVGAVVLLAFDQIFGAYIVGYLRFGYADIVGYHPPADAHTTRPIVIQPNPGDLLLTSYVENPSLTATPIPTGSSIHIRNTGLIAVQDMLGQYLTINPSIDNPTISQSSMSYHCHTEAGLLDFGLVKRNIDVDGETSLQVLNTDAELMSNNNPNALTEFKLRLWETADSSLDTLPEATKPFIELTMGTKVEEAGVGAYQLEKSPENENITVQLKTFNVQNNNQIAKFDLTIDKAGNVSVTAAGAVTINVGGDASVVATGNVSVSAKTVSVDYTDIKLSSATNKVLLDSFVGKFNNHTHTSAAPGSPTTTPIIPVTESTVTSKNVKVS